MKEGLTEYLQMIQEPITRMSTSSAIFKGFSATIVSGIAALSFAELNTEIMVFSFIPVLAFAILDIYYLQLEKKYRYLFNQVRSGEHDVDFSLEYPNDKKSRRDGKSRVIDCILSPSIYLFYPLLIAILLVVVLLRLKGVI